MDSLDPGTLLGRRYRLLDRIGVGGMSVIWRGLDEMLDRSVAVKVLAADLAADDRFRALVRAEARAAAALTHPHVTAAYDYGEAINADGEITAYVVMELLDGEPLSQRLRDGPLPWPEALRVGAEVAEALAAAHRHGIVHRDVTADNVMLTSAGVKVLDFGIATAVGTPDDDSDGSTFGTPAYVAPERLDGQEARPATDTYAFGVLLFEMLTGRLPFPAGSWAELTAIGRDRPPALCVPGLPAAVARLCHRCLAVDPAERPTANQTAWTLRRHLPGTGRRPGGRAQRLLAAAGSVAALATGLLLGTTVLSSGGASDPPPAAEQSGNADPGPSKPRPAERSADPPADRPSDVPSSQGPATATPDNAPEPPAGPEGIGGGPASLDTVVDAIDDGRAREDIRADVALDLHQLIDNLQRELDAGVTDLATATAQLRDKVQTRAAEGGLGPTSAAALETALDQLEA